MRVLYLTDRVSRHGGAGRHLLQVMGWVRSTGWEVQVVAGSMDGGVELAGGTTFHRVRSLGRGVSRTAGLETLDDLLGWADVVHVQNVMNPDALERAVRHQRLIVTVQDHRLFCPGPGRTLPDGTRCLEPMGDRVCSRCLPDSGYRAAMLDLTRRRLRALHEVGTTVVLSAYMAAELEQAGVRRVEVIPPWVDVGPERTEAGEVIIMGGRLVEHKAPQVALGAWERAGRPLPLVVAGSGALEERLADARLLGWLGDRELRSRLRESRMLIFPARWQEPFGILGVEALAEGTPVVVAESGGTGDWSGEGCVTVPPGDEAAMAAAIRELAEDPGEALRLGRAGQEEVERLFSPEGVQRLLKGLYCRRSPGKETTAP